MRITLFLGLMALAGIGARPTHAQQVYHPASPRPAWLGVNYDVRWIQQGESCEPHVHVERVIQGSPAERAGLRAGDVIVALDDQPLPAARLQTISATLSAGDSVRLRVRRDRQLREITAIADHRPARPPELGLAPGGGPASTTMPMVELRGDTLEARNIDAMRRDDRGYWLATRGGQTEYRRLSYWSSDDVDTRVATLLRCAADAAVSVPAGPPTRVDLQRVQQRADSLRIAIARRALAPDDDSRSGTYILRIEERFADGMRGVAGAEVTPLEPELADYFRNVRDGLLVLRVSPDSPADKAGLRPGDVMTHGNGRRIRSVEELRAIRAHPDPTPLQVRIVRKGRVRTITLERPGNR